MESKIEDLENEIISLRHDVNILSELIIEMTKSTKKMDEHIDFVDSVYNKLKVPLNYISSTYNYELIDDK